MVFRVRVFHFRLFKERISCSHSFEWVVGEDYNDIMRVAGNTTMRQLRADCGRSFNLYVEGEEVSFNDNTRLEDVANTGEEVTVQLVLSDWEEELRGQIDSDGESG